MLQIQKQAAVAVAEVVMQVMARSPWQSWRIFSKMSVCLLPHLSFIHQAVPMFSLLTGQVQERLLPSSAAFPVKI